MTVVADAELARAQRHLHRRGQRGGRRDLHQPAASRSTTRNGGSSWPTRCCTPPCATATAAAPATRTCSTSPRLRHQRLAASRWASATMPGGLLYDPELAGTVRRGGLRPDREGPAPACAGSRPCAARARRHAGRSAAAAGRAYRVDLDEFYRRGLVDGRRPATRRERGLLPGGLVAGDPGARATRRCPGTRGSPAGSTSSSRRAEPRRGYARASRRQSSTPTSRARAGTSRPRRSPAAPSASSSTPPGRMAPRLLGKALGAIASYAVARDVPAARVVFCDAAAVRRRLSAGRARSPAGSRVRGRGGTVLQPGIDLLQRAEDFPPDAPILVITDGWCDAAADPARARLSDAARRPAAVHPARRGLRRALIVQRTAAVERARPRGRAARAAAQEPNPASREST